MCYSAKLQKINENFKPPLHKKNVKTKIYGFNLYNSDFFNLKKSRTLTPGSININNFLFYCDKFNNVFMLYQIDAGKQGLTIFR